VAINKKEVFALDIGSASVKAVKLADESEVVIEKFAMAKLPHESIISSFMEKPIISPQAVADSVKHMLENLALDCSDCIIAVPDLMVVVNWLSIPQKVGIDMHSTVKLKLEPLLPHEVDKWFIDHQVVDDSEKNNVITEAILQDTLLAVGGLVQELGYNPIIVDGCFFNVLNLFHDYLVDPENKEKNIAILTMGNESTTVSVFREGVLKIMRNISVGGGKFTKTLMSQLNVTLEEAEKLKREGVFFLADSLSEQNKVKNYNIIKPVFGELIKELYNSFDAYLARFREFKINEIIMTGGTANFRNVNLAIEQHLNIPIKKAEEIIQVESFQELTPDDFNIISTAVGSLMRE
jgi:type IV pilus assembly protein PilM